MRSFFNFFYSEYAIVSAVVISPSVTLVLRAGFSIPLLVALFAYFLLGEQITLSLAIGGLLIFAGLAIFYLGKIFNKIFKTLDL